MRRVWVEGGMEVVEKAVEELGKKVEWKALVMQVQVEKLAALSESILRKLNDESGKPS